jgi:hypothetical protein
MTCLESELATRLEKTDLFCKARLIDIGGVISPPHSLESPHPGPNSGMGLSKPDAYTDTPRRRRE